MTVVSNTSPISNLAAIGQLALLQQVYESIAIPQAVADEIAKVATIYTQAASVSNQPWITIQVVNDTTTVERLRGEKLDAGESEAIALALEVGAELLLIDEQLGRKIAVNEGLNITGLVGVLLEAKNKGFVSKIKPTVDALMIQARFRISSQLYAEILRLAGEP
ncbi:MAG: DUF3368 domain-containing protein [Oculatellaceae cyanobacterium bins.114]|nr:DUF3368 domain-containing protein [Oculatellaceae cyanobacterium bins.114]